MDKQLTTAGREGPQELKQQIYTQLKKAGVVSSLKVYSCMVATVSDTKQQAACGQRFLWMLSC